MTKTKGLTLSKALKALNDNKCIGIRPENFITNDYYKETNGEQLTYFIPATNEFILKNTLSLSTLLGKWNLVTESISTPKTEQRIFNYWIVVWPDGSTSLFNQEPLKSTYERAQHVFDRHQAYIYTYPEMGGC